MAYSKVKLSGSCDKVSPDFRPFRAGTVSDKCLYAQILLYASFKHILINITSFVGILDSVRILCITSLPTKSESFLKGISG
jgi:hypothetical protein